MPALLKEVTISGIEASLEFSPRPFSIVRSRPRERFRVCSDRGCQRHQLASSSPAPRAMRCGREKFLDQLTFRTSCSMTKQAKPSLDVLPRYARKMKVVHLLVRNLCVSPLECGRYCQRTPAPFRRPLELATFRNLRAESSAPLPGRPCPLYATKTRTGLQTRECRKGRKINCASGPFGALTVYHEH